MNRTLSITLVMAAIAAMTIAFPGCSGKKAKPETGPVAPEIFQVSIVPDVPDPTTPLSLSIKPEKAGLRYDVQWFVNGRPEGKTVNTAFFNYRFSTGDQVMIKVRAYAGDSLVGLAESPLVTIADLRPVIAGIDIDPFPVTTAANALTLRPRLKTTSVSTIYRCRWVIDGVVLPDSGVTAVVSNLRAGQKVFVEATPVTGAIAGKTMQFSTEVFNGPPVFSGVTFVSQDSTGNRYVVTAVDRDGDPVSFMLIGYTEGIRLDPANGALFLSAGVRQTTLTIRASDDKNNWIEQKFNVGQ